MKKNIVIILLTVGLIISLFFNYQLKGYKELQQTDYNLKLNHGLQIGIKQSIQTLDDLIRNLENNSPKKTVIYTLVNLIVSLKVGEEAFSFLNPDFGEQGAASTILIYSVFRDFYMYVSTDLLNGGLSNQLSFDKDSRNQLLNDVRILKEDLEYIDSQFNEDILKDQSPKWIEDKWKELIAELISRHPNSDLYERMKMKYNL